MFEDSLQSASGVMDDNKLHRNGALIEVRAAPILIDRDIRVRLLLAGHWNLVSHRPEESAMEQKVACRALEVRGQRD